MLGILLEYLLSSLDTYKSILVKARSCTSKHLTFLVLLVFIVTYNLPKERVLFRT